jgi:hypothetical protein
MTEAPAGATRQPDPWRLAVWAALILGWLFMLLQLWSAFATFPTDERLEHSRMVAIPTLRSLALLGARSVAELAVVLGLTWPWAGRAWLARVWLAASALAVWFIATAPLSLSVTMWVHRRWLAAMVAGLVAVAAVTMLARLTRAVGRRFLRS